MADKNVNQIVRSYYQQRMIKGESIRCWVEERTDGQTYVFRPSYKNLADIECQQKEFCNEKPQTKEDYYDTFVILRVEETIPRI